MESEAARKLSQAVNSNTKDNFIKAELILTILLVGEMNGDVDTATNAMNYGKNGIVHSHFQTPKIIKETVQKFETYHRKG